MAAEGEGPRAGWKPGESVFTPELGVAICGRVAAGESLSRIERDADTPCRQTIRNWARSDPGGFGAALLSAMRVARQARRTADHTAMQAWRAKRDPSRRGGRPKYSQTLAREICDRLANGESMLAIARDPAMPCAGTIYGWVQRHPEFQDMYVTARELQGDYLFDEAREVGLAATPGTVWVGRLQFDIIRWQAARLAPQKYCERVVVAAELTPPPLAPERLIIGTVSFIVGPNGKVLAAPPRNAKDEADWIEAYGEPYNGVVPRRDRT